MEEKRKAGRPKKVVEKQINEIDEVVNYWRQIVASKDEIIEDLEEMLDKSYKEQEEMIDEINKFLHASQDGFEGIENSTGKITYNDVLYHIHFFARSIQHKFGSSTEE